MGCHVMFLDELVDRGLWPRRARVLDFGNQLCIGTVEDVEAFVRRVADPDLGEDALSQHISNIAPRCNHPDQTKHLDLADALIPVGVDYTALDVCPGTATREFDLNHDALHEEERGTYDLVLNFGTTEHLLGQDHAFFTAHDALKVGGAAYHQLPCVGYLGHGYFSYHPLLFSDLAEANGYELLSMWLTGPQGRPDCPLLGHFEDYPGITREDRADCDASAWAALTQRDGVLNVLLRKTRDAPFRRPLEVRTATQHGFEPAPRPRGKQTGADTDTAASVPIYLTARRDLTKAPFRELIREVGVRLRRRAAKTFKR